MDKGSKIINLGSVVWDAPTFHTKKYIYPLNFESVRKLPSGIFKDKHSDYHSKIVRGPKGSVEFWVWPEDDPENINKHHTSSGVWVDTLKRIKKKNSISVSGPEMYGFADPTIQMLIQELPNSEKCAGYIFKSFNQVIKSDSDTESNSDAEKHKNESLYKTTTSSSIKFNPLKIITPTSLNNSLNISMINNSINSSLYNSVSSSVFSGGNTSINNATISSDQIIKDVDMELDSPSQMTEKPDDSMKIEDDSGKTK